MLFSTYTTAENDKKTFDLWSGVTDVIQPSKGFTDEIYGHAITLRLKTCFRYIYKYIQISQTMMTWQYCLRSDYKITLTPD